MPSSLPDASSESTADIAREFVALQLVRLAAWIMPHRVESEFFKAISPFIEKRMSAWNASKKREKP